MLAVAPAGEAFASTALASDALEVSTAFEFRGAECSLVPFLICDRAGVATAAPPFFFGRYLHGSSGLNFCTVQKLAKRGHMHEPDSALCVLVRLEHAGLYAPRGYELVDRASAQAFESVWRFRQTCPLSFSHDDARLRHWRG